MDTATPTQVADHPVRVGASVRRSRRRRPSGAPPPLPRHLETTGVGWLLAAVGLVAVFVVSFAASRRGAAVAVTAADDRVVRWLTELRSGWLAGVMAVAAFPANCEPKRSSKASYDQATAARLWQVSAELVGPRAAG